MRKLLAATFLGLATTVLYAGGGANEKVEVKGPHICCGNCVKVVGNLLKDVAGVSDIKADIKSKTVTFTAKDDKAAQAGVKALVDGGFFGAATADGKELKIDVPAAKGPKADKVTVSKVHVCCGTCQKAIIGIFSDSKVTFDGSGAQRTVTIEGSKLDPTQVMDTLHKKGFNGTISAP